MNHKWLNELAVGHFPERSSRLAAASLPLHMAPAWQLTANLAGISVGELVALVADTFGLKVAALGTPEYCLAQRLPESFASRFNAVPVGIEDGVIVIAVSDPTNSEVAAQARFITGKPVELRIAAPEAVETARAILYSEATSKATASMARVFDLNDSGLEMSLSGSKDLVRFCRSMLKQAIDKRASDIHLHPYAGGGVVRFRIDGILVRIAIIPALVLTATIRMLKAQGGMDSTNSMVPHDGRASLLYNNKNYDLRISTLPASGAEALVMRILDQSRTFSLDKTNFAPWALQSLKRLASSANGLVLITGPTGSGKTSTLYSILSTLNKTSRRIITVEEPVEYKLTGLSQVEVNATAGLTFASALRSILRQDPDILLIGEIRDRETAEIAVQAALTGHLVFSTLHTQNAIRAIPRLVELGVAPAMLADTLLGVVSQRLMRQLCPHCKTSVQGELTAVEKLFQSVTGMPPGARAAGCEQCNYTGYLGRFPVVETFEVPDAVRTLMLKGVSDSEALQHAMPKAWNSIEHNAANWVISGLSTPDEAFSCFGLQFWTQLAQEHGVEAPITSMLTDTEGSLGTEITVLIMTQSNITQNAVQAALDGMGLRSAVVATADALKAELTKNKQIQLLVLDIVVGDNKREEISQQLRQSYAWSGLPFVALFNPEEFDTQAPDIQGWSEHYGNHDFIALPMQPGLLEARIQALLNTD
jgi:type IV pilus assembly protein PilB